MARPQTEVVEALKRPELVRALVRPNTSIRSLTNTIPKKPPPKISGCRVADIAKEVAAQGGHGLANVFGATRAAMIKAKAVHGERLCARK